MAGDSLVAVGVVKELETAGANMVVVLWEVALLVVHMG